MRRLTINGKEYTFKFSIEASLYNECTEATMNMFLSFGEAQGEASVEVGEGVDARQQVMCAMRKTFSSVANIPQTALTLFYAGLMECHGASGDNTVRSITDAKGVLADYLRETNGNFYDVMNMMLEIMGEDHFFDLTGISEILKKLNLDGESEKKPGRKRKTGED